MIYEIKSFHYYYFILPYKPLSLIRIVQIVHAIIENKRFDYY